jgi:murein hydrolase activator
MKYYFLLVFFCASSLFAQGTTKFDREIQQKRNELRQLERELLQQQQQIEKLAREERDFLGRLSMMNNNIQRTHTFISELEQNQLLLDSSIQVVSFQIDSLQNRIYQQKDQMAHRVRSLYMQGRPRPTKLPVQMDGVRNLHRFWVYLDKVLRYDQSLVQHAQEYQQSMEVSLASLAQRMEETRQARTRKEEERLELDRRRKEHEKELAKLQQDRQLQEKALQQFQANQQMLLSLIEALEVQRLEDIRMQRELATRPPVAPKEKCWPVAGQVIARFGNHRHPQLHTITRNLGVEIQAALGVPVQAAAEGRVAMVTRIQGHGTGIILEHGGGFYTVYAHLRDIRVQQGDAVGKCEVIAAVGDEESLEGPKLYFQVSQGTTTIDPEQWIRQ